MPHGSSKRQTNDGGQHYGFSISLYRRSIAVRTFRVEKLNTDCT
jgi:hypothetical protein